MTDKRTDVVPGVMYCAKCKLRLVRSDMNANTGTMTTGDNKTETCPNGCGPLWPVTWEQEAREARAGLEQAFENGRASALRESVAELPSRFQHGDAVSVDGKRGVVESITFDKGQPVVSPFDGEIRIGAKIIYGVRIGQCLVQAFSNDVYPTLKAIAP